MSCIVHALHNQGKATFPQPVFTVSNYPLLKYGFLEIKSEEISLELLEKEFYEVYLKKYIAK
jgi:hypothetical protein